MSAIPESPVVSSERSRRAARIVMDRAAGLTWPEIAKRYGLSERHARRLATGHLASPSVDVETVALVDPVELLARVFRTLDLSLEGCLRIAEDERGKNHRAVSVGAYRAAAKSAELMLSVAERVGLLPSGRQEWLWTRDIGEVARRMLVIAREQGVDTDALMDQLNQETPLRMAATVSSDGGLR
jgi:hypothetical protein